MTKKMSEAEMAQAKERFSNHDVVTFTDELTLNDDGVVSKFPKAPQAGMSISPAHQLQNPLSLAFQLKTEKSLLA
jgi:hypothetical protein